MVPHVGTILQSVRRTLDRLLPFTRPDTPLVQDVLHSVVLAVIIYLAPRILERQLERNVQREREGIPASRDEGAVVENEVIDAGQLHEGSDAEAEGHEDLEDDDDDDDNVQNHNHHQTDADADDDDDAAAVPQPPAHPEPPNAPIINPRTRNVGKKKARSLARKDQNRAYHEFMRQQGDAQRARDREIEAELEAELFEEKRRRALVEQELEEKHRLEREAKRDEERRRREADAARRQKAVSLVRSALESPGFVNTTDITRAVGGADIDSAWVERLVRAEGILGLTADDTLTTVTSTGYIIRITNADMQEAYQRAYANSAASADGKVSFEALGEVLEKDVVRRKGGAKE
ncbi:hypothetical protein GP486_006625 [Trichoglossum hirsutum]|uniref:Uncharacterized protein n=1 Tax=Trichoglossum hirsutum TaxID=265104 RepID=A0A9P8IH06_9PEZI|nr:hypothetical protein GP486_006625 [Trichoglossum hirsutum]